MASEQDKSTPPDAVIDGGDMDCGSGLLLMIRGAIQPLGPGQLLEIRSREPSVREDLPAWCRMVGHRLVSEAPASGGYTHYLVEKRPDQAADTELEDHLKKAREYAWRVRTKWTGGMNSRVFSRNHTIDTGQPASFDTGDQHPGAIELLLASLSSCLSGGFAWRLGKAGFELTELEVSLSGRPDNILVFLAIEDQGSPGFAEITGRVFVQAFRPESTSEEESDLDPAEEIRAIWQDTLNRSPVARTLSKSISLKLDLTVVD